MCFGEKLKNTEQNLIFLKKCRDQRIFPAFIMNSFQLSESLHPLGYSNHCTTLLFNLKKQPLNQHIKVKYETINQLKKDINLLKSFIHSEVEQPISAELMSLFNRNMMNTKKMAKQRLSHKFN